MRVAQFVNNLNCTPIAPVNRRENQARVSFKASASEIADTFSKTYNIDTKTSKNFAEAILDHILDRSSNYPVVIKNTIIGTSQIPIGKAKELLSKVTNGADELKTALKRNDIDANDINDGQNMLSKILDRTYQYGLDNKKIAS